MTLIRYRQFFLALLLTTLLAACSPPAPGPSGPPAGTTSASQGGTISSASTQATLSIPAGGLSADSVVVIAPATESAPAPAGLSVVAGSVVSVSGNGSAALNSGTLNLPFSAAAVGALNLRPQADPTTLRLYRIVDQVWQLVQGNSTISASVYAQLIQTFGTYGLFAPTTVPGGTTNQLASIQLTCQVASISIGATTTCAATALTATGTQVSPQPAFTYASSDPGIARVNASGTVTGVAAGTVSITASAEGKTSNAVGVTVISSAPAGSLEVVADTSSRALIGRAGQVFYTSFDSRGYLQWNLYDNGTRTPMPALPTDYSGVSSGYTNRPCLDAGGNVAYLSPKKVGNDKLDRAVYFNRAAGTVSEIPFPVLKQPTTYDNPVFVYGCNAAGQVLGSTSSGSDNTISAFVWTPGSATVTTLPVRTVAGCVGCSATSINAAGAVLYNDGLYTGGTFTAIGQLSGYGRPNATVLLDDGAAYGTVSAGDGTQLFTWKSGQALTPLGAPVTGTTSTQMTVIGVNASGEALVSVGGQNSSGITVTTHWLYRAGLWNEVKPSSGYTFAATSMNGVADSGRILAEEFSASTYAPRMVIRQP